ncbi:hypothetical protein SCHPADRAFT_889555 [Schizopora paradoxa]|uniref:F-box domain-containing protein n=1 Tax=Schizopora paradoxa TaxID=27342 RepID=A0A0H2RR58_9AGAM|nr:hypothetical protein SCHPADRAFT_889555 [Schizopora paradoxa]
MAKRKKQSPYPDVYEEGTEEYEISHIDPAGMSQISEILKRLKRTKGYIGPQLEWYDKAFPDNEVPFVYSPMQDVVDKRALEQALETKKVLGSAVSALSKLLRITSRQLEFCEDAVRSYQKRRGLFSLPDDILCIVLEFASLPFYPYDSDIDVAIRSVKLATMLSHTCKRFRDIIIRSSIYWRCINNEMRNQDLVSTCLSRCTRPNVEVSLEMPFFKPTYVQMEKLHRRDRPFIGIALQNRERWRSFALYANRERWVILGESQPEYLQIYAELTKEIEFPNLTAISIRYPDSMLFRQVREDKISEAAMHFYRYWSTPKLRVLSVEQFIPIPFPGTLSLSSLDVHLKDEARAKEPENLPIVFDAKSFVSFLQACPALESLDISLQSMKASIQPQTLTRLAMPRLAYLKLNFKHCNSTTLKGFFDAVRFPFVTSMELEIDASHKKGGAPGTLFDDIFFAVMPNSEVYPRLVNLTLDASVDYIWDRDSEDHPIIWGEFAIPFSSMTTVKHLTLTASESEVLPVSDSDQLPALRTFTIRRSSEIEKTWLARFCNQMKSQGHLDSLRISVDDSCSFLNESGLRGTLSEDDILQLIALDDSLVD